MEKIASPQDLRSELNRILAQASEDKPSRELLAFELRGLADRVATAKFNESETRKLSSKYELNFRAVVGFLDELLGGEAPYWIGKRVAEYAKRKNRGE